jgi:hypothetical protein
MLYGRCKEYSQIMKIQYLCSFCNSNRFQQYFDKWTSGNKTIDKSIRDNQILARNKHALEWFPYDNFTDINDVDAGGFAKILKYYQLLGKMDESKNGIRNLINGKDLDHLTEGCFKSIK